MSDAAHRVPAVPAATSSARWRPLLVVREREQDLLRRQLTRMLAGQGSLVLVDGALEMATITRGEYRRRGLAAVVCARTIAECERRGERTWWNAARTNAGSVRLARRLGYRTERPYSILIWRSSSD